MGMPRYCSISTAMQAVSGWCGIALELPQIFRMAILIVMTGLFTRRFHLAENRGKDSYERQH